MIDFDERDLLAHAEAAGFVDIRLTLLAEVTTEPMRDTRDWEVFLRSSPNPLSPTFGEAIDAALTPEEARAPRGRRSARRSSRAAAGRASHAPT